jgi:hypothetical protein
MKAILTTIIINIILLLTSITAIVLSGISLENISDRGINYFNQNITNNITDFNNNITQINYNWIEYNETYNVGILGGLNISIQIKFITDNTTFVAFTLNSKTFPCYIEDGMVSIYSGSAVLPSNLRPRVLGGSGNLTPLFPLQTYVGSNKYLGYIAFTSGQVEIVSDMNLVNSWYGAGLNCTFETTNQSYSLFGLSTT